MVDDLRRQASEIYRERNKDGAIRTSDSLSLRKLTYLAVGLAAVLLIVIQFYGGFESRPNPVRAAATPAPLVKEAPPPEMLEPIQGNSTSSLPAAADSKPAPEPQAEPVAAAKPAPATTKPARAPKPAAAPTDVVKEARQPEPREVSTPVVDEKEPGPDPAANAEPEAETAETPEEPEIDEEETARRELARELTIQNRPAMAELIVLPGNQEWEAAQAGDNAYMVTFIIMKDQQPVHYVWRVNLTTKSVTPLSYYARKLP